MAERQKLELPRNCLSWSRRRWTMGYLVLLHCVWLRVGHQMYSPKLLLVDLTQYLLSTRPQCMAGVSAALTYEVVTLYFLLINELSFMLTWKQCVEPEERVRRAHEFFLLIYVWNIVGIGYDFAFWFLDALMPLFKVSSINCMVNRSLSHIFQPLKNHLL